MRIFHVAETFLVRLLLCLVIVALPQGAALAQGAPSAIADSTSSADAPAEATDATLSGLLDVLKDDTARERLIAALEEAAADGGPAAEGAAAEPEPDVPVNPVSLGRQLAETTQAIAQSAADSAKSIWSGLGRARNIMGEFDADTWATIGDATLDLLLVLLVTVATYIVLRRAMMPVYRRMGRYAKASGPILGLGTGVLAVLFDALIVIVAWAIGYVVTTTVFGEFGQIGLRQTLYLNAFLAVELVKVAARAILSPSTADLRVLSVSDLAAKRCSRVTNIVVSLLGYGQLLVVPIVNGSAGYFAGRAVAAVVAFLAVLYLIAALIRYRESVGAWLVEQLLPWRKMNEEEREAAGIGEVEAPDGEEPEIPRVPADGWLARLLKLWWLPGIAYLLFMLYEAVTQPISAVSDALVASLRVALVVVAGILIGRVISGMAARGVHLPEHINQKIPLLDARINALIPKVLFGVRWIVVVGVVAFALETLGLFSAWSWFSSPAGLALTGTIIVVSLILIIAYAIWVAFSSWVEYRLNPDFGEAPSSRETTLLTLLRNAVTVALIILTLMFALAELGLNIGPLIASAGVLGLAIGFGAQKLVQDIITGVFIQFENAINVGDVVTVGGTTGSVEKLTVRSVTLRDLQGIVHIVPFSSVDMVSNYTREFSFYVVDMGIAYREDVDEAKEAMLAAFEMLREDPEQGAFILGDLEYFGVDAFGDNAVVLRARIKTWPGKQWGVGRAYNRLLKKVFDERGIEIPFPHRTIYLGESKDGHVQTFPVAQVGGPSQPSSSGGGETSRAAKPSQDGPLEDGED